MSSSSSQPRSWAAEAARLGRGAWGGEVLSRGIQPQLAGRKGPSFHTRVMTATPVSEYAVCNGLYMQGAPLDPRALARTVRLVACSVQHGGA